MAVGAEDAPPETSRAPLRPARELPIARVVAVVLILLLMGGAWFAVTSAMNAGSSPSPADAASFNPRTIFTDTTPHFLPTPVAALPAEATAGPPTPLASDQAASPSAPAVEQVKVANTGGVGAILRADPPKGRQVGALRDGSVLQVLEHRLLADGSEWLRVRTVEGQQGWVYSLLVAPTQ